MDGESQEHREARLRSLWSKLDSKNTGYLDYTGLKSGLVSMNHRKSNPHALSHSLQSLIAD